MLLQQTPVENWQSIPCSKFSSQHSEQNEEYFFAFESAGNTSFPDALRQIVTDYAILMQQEGLGLETEIYLRLHLSDISNQSALTHQVLRERGTSGICYLVGQPPASGAKIALEAYHLRGPSGIRKQKHHPQTLEVEHGAYRSLWTRNLPVNAMGRTSFAQTEKIFADLAITLTGCHARLRDDLMRTWIYIRDIDNNYQGVVDARMGLFHDIGLNRHTHTVTSTGIEGRSEKVTDLVMLDALTITGLAPEQVTYLNAPEFMCSTFDYDVSFERGVRIVYGDRAHFYISGTASIDHKGRTLHEGDVIKQSIRTLENIQALLSPYGADLQDLKLLTVYLRDPADYAVVSACLHQELPPLLPRVIVLGSVCRPAWLIEMEGIAVTAAGDHRFAHFC
ncbi:MAG: Rid family hydrolase [Magnetococcus sp. YQC-5]